MPRVLPAALLVLALAGAGGLVACGDDDEADPGLAAPGSVTDIPPVSTAPAPGAGPPTTAIDPGRGDGGSGGPRPTTTLASPDADPLPKEPTVTEVQRPKDPVRCPAEGGFGKSTGGKAGEFDARELLGLATAKAQALARRNDCGMRVVNRDGQDLVRTMDYSSNRINVTETQGRIVRIDGIG